MDEPKLGERNGKSPESRETHASSEYRDLVDTLRNLETGHLAIVTGAGISLASGVPTFRGKDPGAVWNHDVLEKGTYSYFRSDPVASWLWSSRIFSELPAARPNPGHVAVATLGRELPSRGGRVTTLTQNIDTLHEQAGSDDLIKVHGTVDRARCASDLGCPNGAPRGSVPISDIGIDRFLADPSVDTLPRCALCEDLIRQHVLWFDEFYADHEDYQWLRVQETIRTMDVVLFVGTSFSVGVTDAFLQTALMRGIPAFSIDPSPESSLDGLTTLREESESLLPRLCEDLGLGPLELG